MKTVLFDLDGTLIDSRADIALAVNLTRADFDLPPLPAEEIEACVGEGVPALIRRAIPEFPELWSEMLACQRAHYRAHCLDQTVLYVGVVETLSGLVAEGWRLAVVTNKPSDVTPQILEGLGISKYFATVVGGGDCEALKPDPAPLRLAAFRMGVTLDPDDWMVGDHFADMEAAIHAGIRRCFCLYGFGTARGVPYDIAVNQLNDFLILSR